MDIIRSLYSYPPWPAFTPARGDLRIRPVLDAFSRECNIYSLPKEKAGNNTACRLQAV